MGSLPPIFIEFLGKKTGFSATAAGVKTELAEVETAGGGSMAKLGAVSKAALLGIGVAAAVVAVKTVHMAADFQTQMTRVKTGAGELASNMDMVSHGVLAMAGQVGQSTSQLTTGLYTVESAGYHGAAALEVLKVSAQGAKVGAADLGSVTDATTTALNAYKLGAGSVTEVMNALVGTEAEGKTNMEALAGSMSSILPVAAAAHVGLNEVLGAMATMTSQGTSAKVAATYLRQTIGQLSNPTAKAADEMKNLGLNSYDVSKNLGTHGLASTLTMLTDAISKHMGPAGDVLINKLKSVSGSATQFQKVLANLPPTQQTYIGALATMVGGTKSMMAALQLTGPHMATFQKNVAGIADHVKKGGKSVEGWADVQKTFNQRMAEAKGSLEAIGIEIGTALLPAAMKMISAFAEGTTFMTEHKSAAIALGVAVGTILVVGLAAATIAAWNFTAAILANPLTWIVVGIMALVAGLVLLGMHWRAVASWLSGAWGATIHGVADLWHWLASETSSVWNNDIVSPIKAAWRAVSSAVSGAYHDVVDPLTRAWNGVMSVTSTIWNGIAGFFRKWWPLLLLIFFPYIALLLAAWNHFHTAVFSVVTATWNAVAGFLATIWNFIATQAAAGWKLITKYILNPLDALWSNVRSGAKAVSSYLSSIWRAIASTTASAWHSIYNAVAGPVRAVYNYVKQQINAVRSTISSGLHGAYNDVRNIGSLFYSVGRSIVLGMVHGVESLAGSLASSVKNTASSALNGAKSFLGINSPSRKFRDEVGQWIPAGIADGINANAHKAHDAVRSMASGLLGAGTGAVGGTGFGPNALALGSTGGGTVVHNHVTVEVHGSVMADKDLASTFQRVMTQLGSRNSSTYASFKR